MKTIYLIENIMHGLILEIKIMGCCKKAYGGSIKAKGGKITKANKKCGGGKMFKGGGKMKKCCK